MLTLLQYVLAPEGLAAPLSFFAGWMSSAGWIALIACNSSICANLVIGMVSLAHPDFSAANWQTFLLYIAWTAVAFCLNMFAVKILPALEKAAFYWSIAGFFVVIVACLACSHGNYMPAKSVFAQWTNETGWPDGMAFILGLLQSVFGLTAFDAATHMIEEIPAPGKNAPKVMITAVLLGSSTSWIFTVVLLFCLKDLDTVISAATGPLLQIYYQATNNVAGVSTSCALLCRLANLSGHLPSLHQPRGHVRRLPGCHDRCLAYRLRVRS